MLGIQIRGAELVTLNSLIRIQYNRAAFKWTRYVRRWINLLPSHHLTLLLLSQVGYFSKWGITFLQLDHVLLHSYDVFSKCWDLFITIAAACGLYLLVQLIAARSLLVASVQYAWKAWFRGKTFHLPWAAWLRSVWNANPNQSMKQEMIGKRRLK